MTIASQTPQRTTPEPSERQPFASHLRRWRQARGLSQLDLALRANTSQRHVSFLESGKSRPSRGMVLNLAGVLALPLRHQDGLLLAAGFAPAFAARPRESAALQPILGVLDRLLLKQDPFPAVLINRHYDLIRANAPATRLMAWLTGGDALPANLMAMLASSPAADRVENLAEVMHWTRRRLMGEAVVNDPLAGPDAPVPLASTPETMARMKVGELDGPQAPPILTLRLRRGDVRLSLITLIATLGTPLDTGLQDLRMEVFLPVDEATRAWLEAP